MNGPPLRGEDVALFIDWENFKISLATGRRNPNVSALKEEVSNLGRVVVAKAYADWVTRTPEIRGASQFINDPPALYAAGIEPVYVPTRLARSSSASGASLRTTRVKNSVDVKMTADCIECAHAYSNIGTFVLVSGDSDFIHVVNTLRTMGKRVVIIGVSWATSRRLADQVDGLILYDVDVDPVTPAETVTADDGHSHSQSSTANRLELGEVIQEIEEIVRNERQAGGTPLLTSIKQRLMRRFPGFDEKKLGFSGFKKLMARAAQAGNIKLITAGLVDWATTGEEDVPDEILAGESSDGSVLEKETQRTRPKATKRTTAAVKQAPDADGAMDLPEELETTAISDATQVPEPAESPQMSSQLETGLSETTSGLDLPPGPGDGLDSQRAADLIVMADTLEHREGISHVAFNFLVAEVCGALEAGLEAEDAEIRQRWGQAYSRTYVSKVFRGLSEGSLFQRGWHSWRDETSGQPRRRRTFNLDRNHDIVKQVLQERWESAVPAETYVTSREVPGEDEPSSNDLEYATRTVGSPDPDSSDSSADDGAKPESTFLSRLFGQRR